MGLNAGADESWGPKLGGRTKGCVFKPNTSTYDTTVGCDQFSGKAQPWIAHPDNVSQYFRTGSTLSNNLNVSTSGENAGARLSLSKDDVRGIVPNSSLNKLGGTFSANAAIKEKLEVGANKQNVQKAGRNRPEAGFTEGNHFMT